MANPGFGWSVGLQGGHDDQVLADPEHLGVLRPLSDYGWTGRTLVLLTWPAFTAHNDPLEIQGEGAITRYRNASLEGDTDLEADVSYRRSLSSRLTSEASLSGSRFRRGGVPFFDLDLIEGNLRVAYSLRSRSFASLEARVGFPSFRGRALAGDSTQTESDRQARLTAGFQSAVAGGLVAGIEGGYRSTTSNDPVIENSGPVMIARGSLRISGLTTATAEAAFTHRSYSAYPVLVQTTGGLQPTGELRRDRTWQLLVEAGSRVAEKWEAYAGGAWVRQTSNIPLLAYDQSRFYLGVRFTPIQAGPQRHSLPSIPGLVPPVERPYAPLETASGVVFRYHAPTARAVSLVGDFNDWDDSRTILTGPDQGGDWRVTLPIRPGLWRYLFVVDGVWTKPPDAPRYEADGFGFENGVLLVTGNPARGAEGGRP